MKYNWLNAYCLAKKGAEYDYKLEWEAGRYMVGGKMFVMVGGDKQGKPIVTIKCDPVFSQMLRGEYKDIIPGYYMNKEHWNSVYMEGDTPDDILRQMIDMSYSLVLSGLPKKLQKEIAEG
jgi:predicted DNA-binding protein (MmcQ/YjbR family)